jgi:predicted DNA-binding transcriptional regulator YafY
LGKEESLLKLFAALPAMQRREVERLRQRIYIDPTNWFQIAGGSPTLPTLQRAVWEDRQVDVAYQPVIGEVSERRLDAYGLVAKANIWYLVGRKPDGEMRNYRVSRLQQVTLPGTSFERDPDFDLPGYWKETCAQFERLSMENSPPFVTILRVHPRVFWYFPGYLEGRYERLGTDDDGWIRLRVVFDSIDHARTQVLGFGAHAETLEPQALHDTVLETAQAILRFHAEKKRD